MKNWIFLCCCLSLLGCTSVTQQAKEDASTIPPHAAKANIPRSPDPVVRVLFKRGRKLRYNVYNNSGQSFRGLVVIFEGVGCDGVRPRRLWAKVLRDNLPVGDMRPFEHYIPRFCQSVNVTAFDSIKFKRRFRKHKPFVRYNFVPDQRRISYKIYNRSILPFRGITVLIFGKDCAGPKTNYGVVIRSRAWLRPGYLRSFVRNMPHPCRTFRVSAYDTIKLKQRMRKLYQMRRRLQNRQRQLRRRQLRRRPPLSQEI